jgi:hypothetical protein
MAVRDGDAGGFVELQGLKLPPSGRHRSTQERGAKAGLFERDLPDRSLGIAQVRGTSTVRSGDEARSDSQRAPSGSIGPGKRTGPVGSRRRASAVRGAEPSLSRQPWISISPAAGTPSAGTVTVR